MVIDPCLIRFNLYSKLVEYAEIAFTFTGPRGVLVIDFVASYSTVWVNWKSLVAQSCLKETGYISFYLCFGLPSKFLNVNDIILSTVRFQGVK